MPGESTKRNYAMNKAVYAGSFDPITNGHLWMIAQGCRLFEELVVSIGVNPDKKCTFGLDERLGIIKESVKAFPNVIVESFENKFLVDYASATGARYILRGIRTEGDYEYERGMRHVNGDLRPEIVTVFLMPPRPIAEVSSSLVKGMIGPKGWQNIIQQYVPEIAYQHLLRKFGHLI
jgi:pantetheine-phosphate adenylyltransferase